MHYTTYLRWGILGGLFLIPIIPFVIADGGVGAHGSLYIRLWSSFFPYITGKNFLFRIVVGLVVLLYVVLALREPKYRPRTSMLLWATAAFVLWAGVATVFSIDPVKSFWSNFERMEGYVGLLHLFAYFVVLGAMLSAEKLWERFFNVSIAASAVQGAIALLQVSNVLGFAPSSQSGARADGTLGNATYLAVYMLIHIFLTLYMLSRRGGSARWQVLYGLALVLEVGALFFTETRGAVLGVVGGLIVAALWLVFFAREKEWQGLRRSALGSLAGVVVLAGLFFVFKDSTFIRQSPTLSRLASISLDDPTTRARLFAIWPMALQGFAESPKTVVAGWGQENFNFVFNKHYRPDMWAQEQWFDRVHNQFLDWLIAGGLPAFLLYISLYVLAAWAVLRSAVFSTPERAILLGLLAAYTFNNMFVFDNLTSSMYFFALLAFLHGVSRRELPGSIALSRPVGEHGLAVAAPIVGVVVLASMWALNAPAFSRAQTLVAAINPNVPVVQNGITVGGQKDPAQSLVEFKEALAPSLWPRSNRLGEQEAVEQLLQYASNSVAPASVNPEVKQDFFDTAFRSGKELLAQRPLDTRLNLFVGSFLSQFGKVAESLTYLEAARAASPQKQQVLFQLGITYLQVGNATQASTYLKTAFDADPSYDLARILYAGAHYYAGQNAQADAILTEKFGSPIVDDEQLLRIFVDTKQYARAGAIWQLRISKDEKNPQLYLGLASMYFQAGDMAQTIATLRRLAAVDASQAAQVQQLITQIQNGTLKP